MIFNFKWVCRGYFVLLCSLVLASCAGLTPTSGPPEQVVKERSQARLDALMAGDGAAALSYATPSYRQTTTPQQYQTRYAGVAMWTEAHVEKVTCEDKRCTVQTVVSYTMRRPKASNTRFLNEVWIYLENNWYIYER